MPSLKRLFDYIYDGKTEAAKRIIDSATFDVDALDEVVSPTDMHFSLCLTRTLFSRLLGWHDGSHACGIQWTCRDCDDAGGERCKPQSPRRREPSSSALPQPTNLSYDSSLPLAHTSLCTFFSRLLGWRHGSHECGRRGTCRDRDDAGGEGCKPQSPNQQSEPSSSASPEPTNLSYE